MNRYMPLVFIVIGPSIVEEIDEDGAEPGIVAAVSARRRTRGDFGVPGPDADDVVLGAEVKNLLRPEHIRLCREGQMYMVEAVSGPPRLAIDAEEGAEGCGIGPAAPEMEGVEVATNNPPEMVAVGVTGGIAGDRAEINLHHTVPSKAEQPDVQTQFDGEAGKRIPCGCGIRSRGHGLPPTVEIQVVEEQGCWLVFWVVVHDRLTYLGELGLEVGWSGSIENGEKGRKKLKERGPAFPGSPQLLLEYQVS